MKVKLDQGAYLPKRAHLTDAGLDLFAKDAGFVPAHGSAVFETGVHVQLPKDTCGLLVAKSGLNVSFGLTSTGLIDEGYTGEILVKLYNHSDQDSHFEAGDKISQLVILPVYYPLLEVVDYLEETDRGDHGFGSTGR